MMDLDPEFAAQWGIEPEDAYTMLRSPAQPGAPLSQSNLASGLEQPQAPPSPPFARSSQQPFLAPGKATPSAPHPARSRCA